MIPTRSKGHYILCIPGQYRTYNKFGYHYRCGLVEDGEAKNMCIGPCSFDASSSQTRWFYLKESSSCKKNEIIEKVGTCIGIDTYHERVCKPVVCTHPKEYLDAYMVVSVVGGCSLEHVQPS